MFLFFSCLKCFRLEESEHSPAEKHFYDDDDSDESEENENETEEERSTDIVSESYCSMSSNTIKCVIALT